MPALDPPMNACACRDGTITPLECDLPATREDELEETGVSAEKHAALSVEQLAAKVALGGEECAEHRAWLRAERAAGGEEHAPADVYLQDLGRRSGIELIESRHPVATSDSLHCCDS